jgi:hypothetical protein
MMNTNHAFRRLALAASAAAAVSALAGVAQAQMVTGSSGFNSGYNNAGGNVNGGYNHLPDQENGPVNAQTTDLNAPNLMTGAGLTTSPAATSVFADTSGVSGALDTFAGAGSGNNSSTDLGNISVDTANDGSNAATTTNANGKP